MEGRETRVVVIDVDGSNLRTLAEGRQPAWSPEGVKIAFVGGERGPGLYLMDTNGAGVRRLTTHPHDSQPTWSPDGHRLAFTRDGTIVSMNLDGTGLDRLTAGPAFSELVALGPAYSPDGTRIAFAAVREGESEYEVWVMNADGTERTALNGSASAPSPPAWSPDGRLIAFATFGGDPGLHVIDADGENRRPLPGGAGGDTSPAWSPTAVAVP
jgi:TolB protein